MTIQIAPFDVLVNAPFWGGFATIPQNSTPTKTQMSKALGRVIRAELGYIMAIISDITHFLDGNGEVPNLPAPAMKLFRFLAKIVEHVSSSIAEPIVEVEILCCDRDSKLKCNGRIEAWCNDERKIEWVCCKCSESGTISNWQKTKWDMQKNTLH